jgi:DNA mismatch repair protein MutL
MGRIHILSDQVANQIAAGEVVDRPASVVKELLENALDAGATRIRIEAEGGGRKLIRVADDGAGMVRDDALLAFERHATSKLRSSDDLLSISTLGFRGEALPSIASVSRLQMETRAAQEAAGTHIEISGGKVLRCDDAGVPCGTTIAVRDLFFNTPARRKFLKSETTELAHITALVTHYALAHPEKHFELHSATHALLITPPVAKPADRIFQIFGKETLDHLLPVAAEIGLERAGLPEPPPWKRDAGYQPPEPGSLRLSGFASKPELEKLNRNSVYTFVNRRLVRDRVLSHAVGDAYRNILAPTAFPVVLLFLEMPPEEVDVNVHPAKTEVRFRQPSFIHDFVRDSIRNKLTLARPAAGFLHALHARPSATPGLVPDLSPIFSDRASGVANAGPDVGTQPAWIAAGSESAPSVEEADAFHLTPRPIAPEAARLPFAAAARAEGTPQTNDEGRDGGEGLAPLASMAAGHLNNASFGASGNGPCGADPQAGRETFSAGAPTEDGEPTLQGLASLKPLGQLRESFILAVNEEGLWIIDQHVAHERVLFERVLRERKVEQVERQRLLMPMLLDLLPAQMVAFASIAGELERNGFEAELFGPRTIAVKAAPAGLEGRELERMLIEVLEQGGREEQAQNLELARTRIAASIACHAAIKVNTPLEPARMEWLLAELAKTDHPTSCPHGRPIALRYSWKEILRAFHRI